MVEWVNKSTPIDASTVSATTNKRVMIDGLNVVNIHNLQLYDANTYTCSFNGEQRAAVTLKSMFYHYVYYLFRICNI